jgi:hypothetical protein
LLANFVDLLNVLLGFRRFGFRQPNLRLQPIPFGFLLSEARHKVPAEILNSLVLFRHSFEMGFQSGDLVLGLGA